jgi:hypothetical protein
MRKFVVAVLCVIGLSTSAFAKPRRTYTNNSSAPVESRMTYTTVDGVGADNGSAQGVAEMQARSGQCKHFGGNSGYEGVGYSSSSSEAAIRNCCYWGQRKPRDIGVARGPRGWFACVRYH